MLSVSFSTANERAKKKNPPPLRGLEGRKKTKEKKKRDWYIQDWDLFSSSEENIFFGSATKHGRWTNNQKGKREYNFVFFPNRKDGTRPLVPRRQHHHHDRDRPRRFIIGIFEFYWRWWASTHWRLLIEDLEVVFLWAHALSKTLVCVRPESRQRAASWHDPTDNSSRRWI